MATDEDPFDLARFLDAQRTSIDGALRELKAGRKRSHWMWYVFPQATGLGRSAMSERYAIRTRGEAVAYLAHPVLGPRLRECADALLMHTGMSAGEIMGWPDELKLKSSMTLFAALSESGSPFHRVLERYFAGETDPRTIGFLAER